MFTTGYSTANLPTELSNGRLLRKPVALVGLSKGVALATCRVRRTNMALSLRRANSLKDVLMREGEPAQAVIVSEKGPLVPPADGVREPQNRRVEDHYPVESPFDWQQPLSVLLLARRIRRLLHQADRSCISAVHTNDWQCSFQA